MEIPEIQTDQGTQFQNRKRSSLTTAAEGAQPALLATMLIARLSFQSSTGSRGQASCTARARGTVMPVTGTPREREVAAAVADDASGMCQAGALATVLF